MNKFDNILSFAKANWLNLIPSINDMNVLKVGTDKIDNIKAIIYCNPKLLSCIGQSNNNLRSNSIVYYESINDVPLATFDLIIVDESKYLITAKSFSSYRKILIKLYTVLKSDGVILLCLPDNIGYLKYRYWTKKVLSEMAFKWMSYYFCDPSSEYPFKISQYSKSTKWLVEQLPNVKIRHTTIKESLRNFLKNIVFKITDIYNPFRGLIVLTGNSALPITCNDNLKTILTNYCKGAEAEKQIKPFFIYLASINLLKQYVFIYNELNSNLLLVVKIGYKLPGRIGDVRQEYENLLAINICREILKRRNIIIPEALGFESYAHIGKDFTVQSGVPGISISSIMDRYIRQGKREDIYRILNEIVNILIYLQEVYAKETVNSEVSTISSAYFNNYKSISFSGKDAATYLNQVQHGDFAANNIYFDISTNEWGIIDWEWMAKGFPPLFDTFSFFTSIRFIKNSKAYNNEFDKYYLSFIHTYFSKNWFSDYLKILFERYCNLSQIDKRFVFSYFLKYLLFNCNKYRLYYKLPQYQYLYEKMLNYAVTNKNDFIYQGKE